MRKRENNRENKDIKGGGRKSRDKSRVRWEIKKEVGVSLSDGGRGFGVLLLLSVCMVEYDGVKWFH